METIGAHQLRAVGRRVTRPRLSVLDVLAARPHADADTVVTAELRVDNHHHLVCRSRGAVADVDCAVGAAPCLVPSATAGFVVDEAEVVFWGLSQGCQVSGRTGTPAGSGQLSAQAIRGGAIA